MITSMSNRELYKTLTGHDFPNISKSTGGTEPAKFVELNEPLYSGKDTGHIKPLAEGTAMPDNIKQKKENNGILKRDSLELSGGKSGSAQPRSKYSNDIDFNDRYVKMVIYSNNFYDLSSGIEGGVPTKERIAEYYGNMARRLDKAYAEGKFTKEEYDLLNEGIGERMEHSAACAEDTAARRAAGYDRTMSYNASTEYLAMSKEERQDYMQSKVNEYIDRYYKIDRETLIKLFNSIRYGRI
ncbi:MAG: hypothetical protein K2N72_07920 [Oscillospiraceae bacterium]|nr:hypothetical protein [Oscillospiraceae bacterium]